MADRCGPGTRCGHVPGILAGGFLIPGNNGLPDLYVNSTDPAGWASMEIAARQPATAVATEAATTNATTADASGSSSHGGFTFNFIPDWMKSPDYLANLGKGLAMKAGGILLGLAIVIFALYYFTKD